MAEAPQNRTCTICGKPVVVNGDIVAHDGGGVNEQKCNSCGWTGGQADGYQNCPRCGDQTNLVNDHVAS